MVRAAVYRVDPGTVPAQRPMPHLWQRPSESVFDLGYGNQANGPSKGTISDAATLPG